MRMRKKPNLIPRMTRCQEVLAREPESLRGRWLAECPGCRELRAELGCGKGRFTAETARSEPEAMLAAVERVPDAMVVAMERVFDGGLRNVRFLDRDAAGLESIFAPGELSRIYINFCDPWLHTRHHKRRLTAPSFLAMYRRLLSPEGQVWFKTDNSELFDWSLQQFTDCGWTLREVTRDLHANGPQGIMTDYEERFYAQGLPIRRCVAVRPPDAPAAE